MFKISKILILLALVFNVLMFNLCFANDVSATKFKDLTKQIVDISQVIKIAKTDKERHEKLGMVTSIKWDDEKIEKLEQEKSELEEELLLLYLYNRAF